MANHVTTKITGPKEILSSLVRKRTPEEIAELQAHEQEIAKNVAARGRTYTPKVIDPDEQILDFGILTPEPANIETGGCSGRHDEGVICWYEWRLSNWGTKWNGYDLDVLERDEEVEVRFDTAWSHPEPVLIALSEKFPEAMLQIEYADEDLGSNLGQYILTAGETTQETVFDGPEDELEFACQLKYGRSYAELREEWGLDDEEDAS